jgi:hypothetical protein
MTTMTILAIHGTRVGVDQGQAYVRGWKQRPSAVIVSGFPVTDNSTGVSASRWRHG